MNAHAGSRCFEAARAYRAGELSVIPIKADGSKAPAVKWDEFKRRRATDDEIASWFAEGSFGVAVVGGAISGNLEHIDFDAEADAIFPDWCKLVEAECPGLLKRLSIRRTPGNGYHVGYRCPDVQIPGNQKLAMDPAKKEDRTLVETRGEGGYVIVPGSPQSCHPSGRPYTHYSGPKLSQIKAIKIAEREVLIRCARSFDRSPAVEAASLGNHHTGRPGDEFNAKGPDWAEILSPHGWSAISTRGDIRYWRRPGKEGPGWSATTGVCRSKGGVELLAVFSSNAAPFEGPMAGRACSCYSKFSTYALLNHGGDFAEAARQIAKKGYGSQNGRKQPKRSEGTGNSDERCPPEPVTITLATVLPQPVEWLWYLWIPRGCITLLDGDPGIGKSTISLDIAARVSRGLAMPPFEGTLEPPADVILLSAEDDLARTIRPRLDAVEADVERVHALPAIRRGDDEAPPVLPFDLESVEKAIIRHNAALVIVDPIMAYLDDTVDSHKDQAVRRVLSQIASMAERTRAAVLIIRHLNKLSGAPSMYRGGGSIGIIGAARSALLIGRHPDEDEVRVLASNKSNLGPAPRSLTYVTEPVGRVARIKWTGESDLRADDILTNPAQSRRKAEALAEAVEFLEARLQGVAEVEKGVLIEEAKRLDISERTLRRARQKLGIRSRQTGFGKAKQSFWSLPKAEESANPSQRSANPDQLAPIDSDPEKQEVCFNRGQVAKNGQYVAPIGVHDDFTEQHAEREALMNEPASKDESTSFP